MNENQLQLVTFEQTKRLKKLGFDCETIHFFFSERLTATRSVYGKNYNKFRSNQTISAQTVALALKWFRDKRNTPNGVQPQGVIPGNHVYEAWWISEDGDDSLYEETYEAAESALLDELLATF